MTSENISAIILAYNEEKNLPILFETIKEVDEIILIDHESTDQTAKLAKELGAKVIKRKWITDTATEDDIAEFTRRFGFKPIFKAGNVLYDGGRECNWCMRYAKNDWILWIDGDERLMMDKDEINELLPVSDVIPMLFNHAHDTQGNVTEAFHAVKLARKSKTWWWGRIHGAIIGYDLRINIPKKTYMDHFQQYKEWRNTYLPALEFAFIRDNDVRTNYYLAREYYSYGEYNKCIQFFKMYLKSAYGVKEIVKAYSLMAICYWRLGNEAEAHIACFHAMRIDPYAKEPLLLMADFSRPHEAIQWRKFAELGKGEV